MMKKAEALIFVQSQLEEVKSWDKEKKKNMVKDLDFVDKDMSADVLADHLRMQLYSRFMHDEGITLAEVFEGYLRVNDALLSNIEDLRGDIEYLEACGGHLEWKEHRTGEPLKDQAVIHYFDVTGVNAGVYRGDGHYSSTLGGFLGGDVTHYIVRHWHPSKSS